MRLNYSLLEVVDQCSGVTFLIDAGVEVSIIPALVPYSKSFISEHSPMDAVTLHAANGTQIRIIGNI